MQHGSGRVHERCLNGLGKCLECIRDWNRCNGPGEIYLRSSILGKLAEMTANSNHAIAGCLATS